MLFAAFEVEEQPYLSDTSVGPSERYTYLILLTPLMSELVALAIDPKF